MKFTKFLLSLSLLGLLVLATGCTNFTEVSSTFKDIPVVGNLTPDEVKNAIKASVLERFDPITGTQGTNAVFVSKKRARHYAPGWFFIGEGANSITIAGTKRRTHVHRTGADGEEGSDIDGDIQYVVAGNVIQHRAPRGLVHKKVVKRINQMDVAIRKNMETIADHKNAGQAAPKK